MGQDGMQLFRDFLSTDIMNHLEVIKEIMVLDENDEKLLIPILEALEKTRMGVDEKGNNIKEEHCLDPPFYPPFDSDSTRGIQEAVGRQKNPAFLLKAHSLFQNFDWRGHTYNVFHYAYLYPMNFDLVIQASICCFSQLLLFYVLVTFNVGLFEKDTDFFEDRSWRVYAVASITSLYFLKSMQIEISSSKEFYSGVQGSDGFNFFKLLVAGPAFDQPLVIFGKKHNMKKNHEGWVTKWVTFIRLFVYFLDFLSNTLLAFLMTLFNFFFVVLISSNANDAVLNSLALAFILQLDDIIDPMLQTFDEDAIKDAIARRALVSLIRKPMPKPEELYALKSIGSNGKKIDFSDSDRIYIWVEDEDEGTIKAARRVTSTEYEHVLYSIGGTNMEPYFDIIKDFNSCRDFFDIRKTLHAYNDKLGRKRSTGFSMRWVTRELEFPDTDDNADRSRGLVKDPLLSDARRTTYDST